MIKKWEYLKVQPSTLPGIDIGDFIVDIDIEKAVENITNKGWELIGVTLELFIFKREEDTDIFKDAEFEEVIKGA